MLLYFYQCSERSGQIRETAAEVIETPKTYRSATDNNFPGLYKRKMEKSELNRVVEFCSNLIFISEVRDASLARDTIVEYCERKYRNAAEVAEKWSNRSAGVRAARVVREGETTEAPE